MARERQRTARHQARETAQLPLTCPAPTEVCSVLLNIDDLRPHPFEEQIFTPATPAEIRALAQDLPSGGATIEVSAEGTVLESFDIVRALQSLGRTTVRCLHEEWMRTAGIEEIEARLVYNVLQTRSDLSEDDCCRAWQAILDRPGSLFHGEIQDIICERLGKSRRELDAHVRDRIQAIGAIRPQAPPAPGALPEPELAQAEERHLEDWPLDALQPHPRQAQIFRDLPDAELVALADDLQQNGLLQPIEITAQGVIIAGHQRVRAARRLGWPRIRCWVRDDLTPEQAEVRLVADNLHRRHLSRLEKARCAQRLRQLDEASGSQCRRRGNLRDDVGRQLGMSGRTVDRLLLILRTPVEVQDAWDANGMSHTQAVAIARMPDEEQQRIAEQLREGTFVATSVRAPPRTPRPQAVFRRLLRELAAACELPKKMDHFSRRDREHLRVLDRGAKLIAGWAEQIRTTDKPEPSVARAVENIKNMMRENGRADR